MADPLCDCTFQSRGTLFPPILLPMPQVIAELTRAAETCEHNAPIHEAEGNAEQAALSRANAANYRAAIEVLAA
jgi:hypothetical protein